MTGVSVFAALEFFLHFQVLLQNHWANSFSYIGSAYLIDIIFATLRYAKQIILITKQLPFNTLFFLIEVVYSECFHNYTMETLNGFMSRRIVTVMKKEAGVIGEGAADKKKITYTNE